MTGPKRAPIYHADHIEIVLTRGYSTFVDLDCPSNILGRMWCTHKQGYAISSVNESGSWKMRFLHRMLIDAPAGMEVDHIDRDPLNNRRANLRVCTRRQNMANIGARSGFRGVYLHKHKWQASLQYWDGTTTRSQYLGRFDTAEEAARVWDAAALASGLYDPAFLRLNFPSA